MPRESEEREKSSKRARLKSYLERRREKPLKRGFVAKLAYIIASTLSRKCLDIEIRGLDKLPKNQPFIIAANHETYVDALLVENSLPKELRKITCSIGAMDLLTRYGSFGRLIMHVGRAIPINRFGNPIRAMNAALGVLAEGKILIIHPEGTRTHDGRLGKIHEGACFLALKALTPIVPCFIDGGFEIFSRHMRFPKFKDKESGKKKRLIISFGNIIRPEDYPKAKLMTKKLSEFFERSFENKEVPRTFVD